MLSEEDIKPKNIDYKEYTISQKLYLILGEEINQIDKKNHENINIPVEKGVKIPCSTQYEDLTNLHYIILDRKVNTVLEFGIGKSSKIIVDALKINKIRHHEYVSQNLRKDNLFECHTVDDDNYWINDFRKNLNEDLSDYLKLYFSKLSMTEFCGRICTLYDSLPNINPDLIYIDGPGQYSPIGEVRGINTSHKDRTPMAADILSIEHFLHPGTLIVFDGRTANARFLKTNLQRDWAYFYSNSWDQHFFELQEEPLGKYNKLYLDHCLGNAFFERMNRK